MSEQAREHQGGNGGNGRSRPRCPICKSTFEPGAVTAPFCSERCKKVDLGRWLDGQYIISRPIEESDLDEGE